MNEQQYKVAKSVLNVGADPKKFAAMVGADYTEMLAVRNTNDYKQFKDLGKAGMGFNFEDMLKGMGL